jgi:YHS domain-containing protein
MRKEIRCEECNCVSDVDFSCDTCGKNLISSCQGIPITIEFSYGSPLDGETYYFCNNKCAIDFLTKEEIKNNPRNDLEFGKEN